MPRLLPFFLFAVLALLLRLPGLGQFMTVDEEVWMLRSGEYWDKLLVGDPAGTFVSTHPGATVNWLAGGGIMLREWQTGEGIDTSNLAAFRLYGLIPITVVSALLIGWAAHYLIRLFGLIPGSVAALLVASDPYLIGMNQVIHVDSLLGLFMLDALLAFLIAITSHSRRFLLVSGILTGLALATKMLPAFWLFVLFGVILLVRHASSLRVSWQHVVRISMYLLGVSMLTYVLLWPALWAKYDNLDQYIGNDTTSVVTQEHTALDEGEDPIAPASFYLRTLLGRTTPFTLLVSVAVILTTLGVAARQRKESPLLWVVVYALGYIVLITFVAKKADRYALPTLAAFLVLAGLGAGVVLERFKHKRAIITVGLLIGVSMVIQPLLLTPYAIAYNNPLFPNIRPLTQQGWGEGLDAAARWINDQPFDERLHIASWYPGVTGTFFEGRTMSLSSREDHRVGYVVTYRNMLGRPNDTIASDVLDEFKEREAVHTIEIQGKPYVWIYNVLGPFYFRQNTGELTVGSEAAQVVPVFTNDWNRIDFGLATFGRENTGTVTLHIRDRKDGEDIRIVTQSVTSVPDQGWQAFEFDPIADSAGKTYYAMLTSDTGQAGNAITVRYSSEDLMPGNAVFGGREREGDLAYRL